MFDHFERVSEDVILRNGQFSDAVLAKRKRDGVVVLLTRISLRSVLQREDCIDSEEIGFIEGKLLLKLGQMNHANVVEFFQLFTTNETLYLVSEYCPEGKWSL